jgi:group I intron endonuclease
MRTRRVIYRIWHDKSSAGRVGYIGKDTAYPKRLNLLRRVKEKGCPKLYRAFKKYPMSVWRKEILVSGFRSDTTLNKAEIYWIKKYDSKNKGYNCTDGGDGRSGSSPSAKTRKKLRDFNLGKNAGRKNPFYGKTHSSKTISLLRKLSTGRKRSEESLDKFRWVPINPKKIISLYVNKKRSVNYLSIKFKVSTTAIRNFLNRNNVYIRGKTKWVPNNPEEVTNLYVSGYSLSDLEKICKISRHMIKIFLMGVGISIRNKSDQHKFRWALIKKERAKLSGEGTGEGTNIGAGIGSAR